MSVMADDSGAPRKPIWQRPRGWIALVVLFVIASTVGLVAGKHVRARREFDRGVTDGERQAWHDRDLHAYQAEMSLAGLSSDRYPSGSGCYIARYDLSTRIDTSITGKIVVRKLPRFSPFMQMAPGRYYRLRGNGTVSYRDR